LREWMPMIFLFHIESNRKFNSWKPIVILIFWLPLWLFSEKAEMRWESFLSQKPMKKFVPTPGGDFIFRTQPGWGEASGFEGIVIDH